MRSHLRFALIVVFSSMLAAAAVAAPAAEQRVEPNGKLAVIDLSKVKVGGEIGRRIGVTINNNLTVNIDRDFLRPFHDRNGALAGYVGLGKFLDSTINFARYTNDPKLIALKDHIVKTLLADQLADGYLGFYPAPKRIKTLWDLHEMVYLIFAFVDDYRWFHDQAVLDSARRIADYIIANRPGKAPPRDTGKLNTERAMIALTQATGDQKYLNYAVDGMDLRTWSPRVAGHAYTFMNICLAQLDLYRMDPKPDEKLLSQSRRVIDLLTKGDGMMIDGTCSLNETFNNNQECRGNVGENCATAYLIRLAHYLLQIEEKSLDGDIMERAIYNALFASEAPDGEKLRYFTCLEGPRVWFNRPGYCCPGNFRRIISELPEMIYYRGADGILVNLYAPSETEVALKQGVTVAIKQETDYPSSGLVHLTLSPDKPAEFALKLRIPRWCAAASVTVNDGKPEAGIKGGQFFSLQRKWQKGDRVTLDMPMMVRAVKGRKMQAGKVALMRGPMLFCLNASELNKPAAVKAPRGAKAKPAGLPTIDLKSITVAPDKTVRPDGIALHVNAWSAGRKLSEPSDLHLVFTEFADPAGTLTYLPANGEGVDDELVVK